MGSIADIAERRGDYDEALRIRREVTLPVYERLGDTRGPPSLGQDRGHRRRRRDYDEALRIRREVELPVYERLGDTRAAAVTWGKIADIAERRGDYDEALRIRREVELVDERLGDTWEAAVTWGKIADIAERRGDYDEALRIRREVDCRSMNGSVTPGKPPSPGARSRTSPNGGGTMTRRCASAAR